MVELVKSEVRIDNKVDELQDQLKRLLRKLFQFGDDAAILDFGIYRIMNQKRAAIEKFIDRDLIDGVEKEFGKVSGSNKEAIRKDLEAIRGEIRSTFGEGAINANDAFSATFSSTPAGQKLAVRFDAKKKELANADASLDHRKEVYNHLYQFFSRYFDNGDFMSMYRHSTRQKYSIPYNGEEVILHWTNKDQYYIKTGEFFNNYSFWLGNYRVHFHIIDAETTHNNTKAVEKRVFVLRSEEPVVFEQKTKELIAYFDYRPVIGEDGVTEGTRNLQEIFLEKAEFVILNTNSEPGLKTALSTKVDEKNTLLRKHLTVYARRNTTDYFIHKRLKTFLTEELDFYIKNEMFHLDDLATTDNIIIEQYLNRVRVMKAISLTIIDFVAQIEDFQKMLFEKKKFVVSADYCMTLDRVPEAFYPEIARTSAQIAEWKDLYGIGEPVEQSTLSGKRGNAIDVDFLKAHPYLVLDTRFFPQEFKDQLLATFDDLDEVTGGLLVKSENWQALNLLQDKYQEKVKCIYIDPPYNTGSDEGFLYKDNYMDSSWASMLNDRLVKSAYLLSNTGTVAISIDLKEISNIIQICDIIFGKENRRAIITVKRSSVTGPKVINKGTVNISEYVVIYSKNVNLWKPKAAFKERDRDDRYSTFIENRDKSVEEWIFLPLLDAFAKAKGLPKKELKAKFGENFENEVNKFVLENVSSICRFTNLDESKRSSEAMSLKETSMQDTTKVFVLKREGYADVYIKNGNVILFYQDRVIKIGDRLVQGELLTDIWDDVLPNDLHNEGGVSLRKGKKPEKLINRIYDLFTDKNETILDFFVGSGTSSGVAQKTDRFFIGIDSESYFEDLAIRRMKNTLNGESSGISKQNNWKGGGMFKYIYLEQYEDTLNNIEFIESGTVKRTLEDFSDYFIRYVLDFETKDSPCRLNVDKLERPFDYSLKITENNEIVDKKIDLIDTFNYLLGIHVKKILTFENKNTKYKVITGEKDLVTYTIIWRTTVDLDLEADKKYIEETILPKNKAEKIFINGDFFVERAEAIEPVFQTLMGA
jgi:adenine-specific DNA-methyltransferase